MDRETLRLADMLPYEKILVANVSNGERFETYLMESTGSDRVFEVNGAAAHLASPGDIIIVMAFAQIDRPPSVWSPRILILDERNDITSITGGVEVESY